ncbi:SDR family NAD(P)-dependent oxidoreductase [Clostridium baratii]|uniref:SDR family NAD(P)-dependent oxidoreductase n=1 Tax=Clostridium baratii TaxID=1561 RepID=UPI0028FE7EFD|nr:SDR family NAD(P)-dependent oxidoreductase [Clostridium baratii]MDU1054404.1 SDR family NAD(P)-dependent oxidoreductase [Clostridium baratii]
MKEKVVVITGGSTGIGKAVAIACAKNESHVIILSIEEFEKAQEAVREIRSYGGTVSYYKCDVSNEDNVAKVFSKITSKYGHIDYAFNNAGIGPDGVRMQYKSLVDLTEKEWNKVLDVNMKGVWLCMKYELMQMRNQRNGAIVNTASIGGYKMAPCFGAYGPSKAGVIALTELAALENAEYNVKVNCICPGPIKGTELSKNSSSVNPDEETILCEHVIPLKRMGVLDDVVNSVMFLFSSAHTTGQKFFIDGGMHVK